MIDDPTDLRTAYAGLTNYHATLVGARFTVAGLYVTAFAVLIAAICTGGSIILASGAGLLLSITAWILEIRNTHILQNVLLRGLAIESGLRLGSLGFFTLMESQPLPLEDAPSFPRFLRLDSMDARRLFSHRSGLALLYGSTLALWLTFFVFALISYPLSWLLQLISFVLACFST